MPRLRICAAPSEPVPSASALSGLDTPCLLLDRARLERNAAAMRARAASLGVTLRPHFKTAKSLEVARLAEGRAPEVGPGAVPGAGGEPGPVTASTLAEAECLAAAGWRDVLYAVAIAPAKLPRAARLVRDTGATLRLVLDGAGAARALSEAATALDLPAPLSVLLELDCGEHRSGAAPASDELLAAAAALRSPALRLDGVMTHAGHSYGVSDPADLRALAERERAAAADSAAALREAGHPCPVVSVGSSPTLAHAEHLRGVTEARAGVYLFWDLAQHSRGLCAPGDIAASVLTTVIGHQRRGPALVLDAGALALSKDLTANRFLPDTHYGWVCDVATGARLGTLAVTDAYQEHGMVPVPDEGWFDRLPVGSLVRVLPNHACLTAAAHTHYHVLEGGRVAGRWERMGGW